MSFWSDFGSHIKGMGEGVVSIVGGIGAQIQSGADYQSGQAALMQAEAANLPAILAAEKAERDAQRNQLYIIFAAVFLLPLVVMLIYKLSQK
jgi:hypothetical protein